MQTQGVASCFLQFLHKVNSLMAASHVSKLFDAALNLSYRQRRILINNAVDDGRISPKELATLEHVMARTLELKQLVPNDLADAPRSADSYTYYKRRVDSWLMDYGDSRFSPNAFKRLCEEKLRNYRYISLTSLGLNTSHIDQMLARDRRIEVRMLNLSSNLLGDALIPVFHTWFNVNTLEHIDLSNNPITFEGLKPFFSELTFPNLRKLTLPCYPGQDPKLPSDEFKGLKLAFENDHPRATVKLI